MKHTEKFYEDQWRKYKIQYNRQLAKNTRYGLPMAQDKLTLNEFKYFYEAAANDPDVQRQKQSIAKILAQRQGFNADYSALQKREIRKKGKALIGEDQNYRKKVENLEAFDIAEYAWFELGWDANKISSDIFGSP